MAASKPSSVTRNSHFSGPPAMPTTRQPFTFPISPTPPPHRRVERDVQVLDQELALAGLRYRLLDILEVLALGQADGPRGQPELVVDGVGADAHASLPAAGATTAPPHDSSARHLAAAG